MNESLTKILLDDFPRLFRNRNESSMQLGFECGDGWFGLIYQLSHDIEAIAREGGLNPDAPEWPLCRQVKEKMGSLRFVVFAADEHREIYERIGELRLAALNRSLQICEQCGQPGELVTEGYIATLCQERTCHALTERTTPTSNGSPP